MEKAKKIIRKAGYFAEGVDNSVGSSIADTIDCVPTKVKDGIYTVRCLKLDRQKAVPTERPVFEILAFPDLTINLRYAQNLLPFLSIAPQNQQKPQSANPHKEHPRQANLWQESLIIKLPDACREGF
jgi:hypothetical protein